MTDSCYQIAVTFLTRSFVIVSRTFPLRFLIWDETKSLFTGFGGEEAWGVGGEQEGERGGGAWEDGWRGRKGGVEERRKGGGEEEEVGRKMNNRTSFGWTSSKLTLILGSQGKKKCVALKDPL